MLARLARPAGCRVRLAARYDATSAPAAAQTSRACSPDQLVQAFRDRDMLADVTRLPAAGTGSSSAPAVYCGFDSTADSLHIGNLAQLVALARCRRMGWSAVALVGGATTLIGDPSGRSTERPLLHEDQASANMAALTAQMHRVLQQLGGDAPLHIVNNASWIGEMSVLQLLRGPGRHFRVGSMLGKDSVRSRMHTEHGISFTEFSYQVFQALDFAHLTQHYGVLAQIGGADQWGNITAGIELVRRSLARHDVFGFTLPLLTTADGVKFGKSAGNAVWLDALRTPVYTMYQYLVNVSDEDVAMLLRALTLLEPAEINEILQQHAAAPHQRHAQSVLADSVCRVLHGAAATDAAVAASRALFTGAVLDAARVGAAHVDALLAALQDVPQLRVPRPRMQQQAVALVDLAVEAGAAKSKAEARRTIAAGGLYLNNCRVDDVARTIDVTTDVLGDRLCLLRVGKKRYHPVLVVDP